MKYKKIKKQDLRRYFEVNEFGGFLELKYQRGKNKIIIDKEFFLDENVASLAGMMPDGSLIKDLKRMYFHQKKDMAKIYLFRLLIKGIFNPKNKVFIRKGHGAFDAYINSQTLAVFCYKMLQFSKSDEEMRTPAWIFTSPKSVKVAYLQQVFDMEGTILKKMYEIRLITKDKSFALDLQKLLLQLKIESKVRSRIGGTHRTIQYRLSIYGKENFSRFKEIGFRIPFLQERFKLLVRKYKI